MDERPCTHVFSPCSGPCSSYLYRAAEIDPPARRSSDDRWNRAIIWGSVVLILITALTPIVGAGVANWKAEQHRQISQARV